MRSEYKVREIYVGDGLTSEYTFDFKIVDKEHILILNLDPAGDIVWEVRATDTSYFTTTLNKELDGGKINLYANLTINHRIVILLADDEPTQPSKYTTSNKYTLKKIENTFDYLAGQIQRIRYLTDRSFKFPEKVIVNTNAELPEVTEEGVLLTKYDSGTNTWYIVTEPRTSFQNPAPSVSAAAASLQLNRIANEPITLGDCVKAISNTHVALATNDDTVQAATVMGIAKNNANTGETVTVVLLGVISDPIFNVFNVNDILFLDVDGAITDDRPASPTANFLTPVGTAQGGGEILISIGKPTQLN